MPHVVARELNLPLLWSRPIAACSGYSGRSVGM